LEDSEEKLRQLENALENSDGVYVFETVVIGKGHRKIPVRLSASAVRDGRGRLNGIVVNCHDLSQIRTLEATIRQKDQFLASILRNSADAILTLDPQERITSWNKGAETIFGYTEQEILGQSLEVLIPRRLREQRELEKISEITRIAGYLPNYQTQRLTKDGQVIDVLFTRTAIKDYQGNLVGFSSVLKDVTEQKLMERHLVQTERVSAIGELAAGLAHEIKNPLAGIKGAIEIIRDGLAEENPHRTILGEVLSEVNRIDRSVINLLSYSKPKKPNLVKTDLAELIGDVISLLRKVADPKGILLNLEHSKEIPAVTGDEHDLKQLFMNLLLNSIEAIQDKGQVWTRIKVMSDSKLRVEVSDNGPGIPADQLSKIFQPFYTTKKQGTGLGLATCKRIVMDHGGEIGVKSELGKGTSFFVQLPINSAVPMFLALH
jgi:two-component system sporulation sensor kinase A